MSFDDPIQQEIWDVVRELNRAWTQGAPRRLARAFHPEMLAYTPTERRLESGAACLAGWEAFARKARIHSWHERRPLVRVHGEGRAAVVAYEYELDCEIAGQGQGLEGRDLLFLVKEEGGWRVVADQFSPLPA